MIERGERGHTRRVASAKRGSFGDRPARSHMPSNHRIGDLGSWSQGHKSVAGEDSRHHQDNECEPDSR